MTPEAKYNDLPEGFEGEQKRRTEFESLDEKLSYDADGLIALAKKTYKKGIVTVGEVVDLATRSEDNVNNLRRAVAIKLKNPEQVEIDERLIPLVVEPINALPEAQRVVNGEVRSGEEIARAIPDVEAFLDAVSRRKDGKFCELNEAGQLVIEDGCPEAYGLGEDFPTAKMRQACIWYLDEQGETQSLRGEELYTKREVDGKDYEVSGKVTLLELTDAAKKVKPTMVSGLPTLKWDGERHTGEYVRVNTGQLERKTATWTDDDSLDASRARDADWDGRDGVVCSSVRNSYDQFGGLGSRGLLRVNLNFES